MIVFLIPGTEEKQSYSMPPPRVGERVLLPGHLEGFVVAWVEWVYGERGLSFVYVQLSRP